MAVDNPLFNTTDADLLDQLIPATTLAESDTYVEVLALTATGNTFFLQACGGRSKVVSKTFRPRLKRSHRRVTSVSKPLVALLNASALGAGLEVSLLADFRLGTTTSHMGFPKAS